MRYLFAAALMTLLAMATVEAHSRFSATPTFHAGINTAIDFKHIGDLPEWAREAAGESIGSPSQVRAAVIDLNRDGQPEVLIAAAPRTYDIHVPDRALTMRALSDSGWVELATDASCRPHATGAFLSNGWWDLRCRVGSREIVLRYHEDGYRTM